jgi:hypothetical protein
VAGRWGSYVMMCFITCTLHLTFLVWSNQSGLVSRKYKMHEEGIGKSYEVVFGDLRPVCMRR